MIKRSVPLLLLLVLFAIAASRRSAAYDFHAWREDGTSRFGSSVGQQSTNQAFNLYEDLIDPAFGSFALYWKGELQGNGGATNAPFGDVPPTADLMDTREQDLDIPWASWGPVTNKTTVPPVPKLTPNLPQAWGPLELDLDSTNTSPDHLVLAVNFEPPRVGASPYDREQVLNAYYPQTSPLGTNASLPGNAASLLPEDVGRVRPLWRKDPADAQHPGLRIRDLEPLDGTDTNASPGVGVVTQAPILARVPSIYKMGSQTVAETVPVVYLVVGTGEDNDYARVICINLKGHDTDTANPNDNITIPDRFNSLYTTSIAPPNDRYFNPNNANGDATDGDVMWSYRVEGRGFGNPAVPVAGISFANIGDNLNSRPLLFVTTTDGQLICLNAKAADIQPADVDGDPQNLPVSSPTPRWIWKSPDAQVTNPASLTAFNPGFHYGMAPAVARVPLANAFPIGGSDNSRLTVTNAINKHGVTEWMVFAADTYGRFWAWDAEGVAQTDPMTMKLTGWDPGSSASADAQLVRWTDYPKITTDGDDFRRDPMGSPERFIVPPVVYQGNSPLRNSAGAVVNGSTDRGYDDEVIFASERGNIYALDCIGELEVHAPGSPGAADDGKPTGKTFYRWQFPQDDTAFAPAAGIEPRAWPRNIDGGSIAQDANFFIRSPLGVALGGGTNPDGFNPNLDIGDDVLYVPYLQELQPVAGVISLPHYTAGTNTPRNSTVPAGYRAFYEYVGSMKPYGFVQTSRPILDIVNVEFEYMPGVWKEIPLNKFQVGTVKFDAIGTNDVQTILAPGTGSGGANPNYLPGSPIAQDTLYLIDNSYYHEADDQYYTVPMGTRLRIEYTPPTSATDSTPAAAITETLDYPSAHRRALSTPNDPDPNNRGDFQDFRERASLTVGNVRLEQRLVTTRQVTPADPITVDRLLEEGPALVKSTFFAIDPYATIAATGELTGEGGRAGGMIAAGSAGRLGSLFVPSWFRGRVNAYTHRLDYLRPLYGCMHPNLATNTPPSANAVPAEHFGPPMAVGTPAEELNTYDPGLFYILNSMGTEDATFLDDFPVPTDVGSGSMALTDGWLYTTYRNGHVRGWSNIGSGTGTFGPNGPIYNPPLPGTNGTLVEAPGGGPLLADGGATRGIFMLWNPETQSTNVNISDVYEVISAPNERTRVRIKPVPMGVQKFNRVLTREPTLLFEYGQSIVMAVDFGPATSSTLKPTGSIDPDDSQMEIDEQILDQDLPVQGQIRSSNGAVQQIGTPPRGTRPMLAEVPWDTVDHVVAFVPIFCGIPSPSNALTPGTPLLWERDPASANWNFTGELTYDIQITQPGVQWRWPDDMATGVSGSMPNTTKQHYWEVQPNIGSTRFPTTGGATAGTPNWNWSGASSEWAPLVSYNNPLLMYYDPDGGTNPAVSGIVGPGGVLTNTVGAVTAYTTHDQMGRKNGDVYDLAQYAEGSRSGAGRPVVPVVGVGATNAGSRQLLFADHGKASPVQKTGFPDLARLRVADRSYMGLISRQLSVRVQPAALTKMGKGAAYGNNTSDPTLRNLNPGGPAGSLEQNATGLDDAPNGLYSSIPDQRLLISKASTGLNLANNSVPIGGRNPANPNNLPAFNEAEVIAVQVDVPRYAADDIYSTRYRASTPAGSDPSTAFNPLYPSSIVNGTTGAAEAGRPLFDRAEAYSRAPSPSGAPAAELITRGEDFNSPFEPNVNDRNRRVAIYIDANGNGQLDLLPTYREAYRTFAVQVAVKPEMKLEGQAQLLDFGSIPHGKRQPGLDASPGTVSELTIREYQRMNQMAGGTAAQQNIAGYWQQFWRPFTISNTGNVNLAYVKPEVAFTLPGPVTQLVGVPSEGNDPWRVLPFINASTVAALQDPMQIFLRTSFDDQLLPTIASPYGNGRRGMWLQKAAVSAGAPGSVLYAAGNGMGAVADPVANAANTLNRDPSVSGTAREGYVTLNIPTGSPLGQYAGSLRFYNDRTVTFVEDLSVPAGYRYVNTLGSGVAPDGTLARAADGTPIEPVTDPPFKIKARVSEALVFGRGTYDDNYALTGSDPERRMMPAALPDAASTTPQGQAQRLLLAYSSNRLGLGMGSPNTFDLFGSQMVMDSTRLLFPFDELQHLRPATSFFREPWTDPGNPAVAGFAAVTGVAGLTQITKPAIAQDATGSNGYLMWVARNTITQGNDQFKLQYQSLTGGPIKDVNPGGVVNPLLPRSGVRMVPVNGPNWLAFSALGNATRRGIVYTNSGNPGAANAAWTPEHEIATSKSLNTVNNPHVITANVLDAMGIPRETAYVSYDGTSQRLGRTDLYMTRYLTGALTTPGQRGSVDPLNPSLDYGQVGFPRIETFLDPSGARIAIGGEVLQANPTRTVYTASAVDWLIRNPAQDPGGNFRVQVYLSRPEIPAGSLGSFTRPIPLIATAGPASTAQLSQAGELVFPLDPALAGGNQALQQLQILVDASAGSIRFTMDTRTLARLLMAVPALGPGSPDPIVAADYTPATMRLTRGDVSGTNPILVPTISSPARTIYDASWFLQQRDGTKWNSGLPVAGVSDRLWVFWRRATGTVTGGPTVFYKVLRPGIRVRQGAIYGITPAELAVSDTGGSGVLPQEVNPVTGSLFFTAAQEGQTLNISYRTPTGGTIVEQQRVRWIEEQGETPVPMETSVNEGSLDAFPSFEEVGMTGFGDGATGPSAAVIHLERIWMFWSSTRNSGGDLVYAAMSPRLGPEPNINGSVTRFSVSNGALARLSAPQQRQQVANYEAWEKKHPTTVPMILRRGPLTQTGMRAGAARKLTK